MKTREFSLQIRKCKCGQKATAYFRGKGVCDFCFKDCKNKVSKRESLDRQNQRKYQRSQEQSLSIGQKLNAVKGGLTFN